MPKPILLSIDDDSDVLRAIERDLRSQYGAEYRVIGSDSPDGATYSEPPQKLTPSSKPTRLQYSTRQLRNMAVVEVSCCQALAEPSESPSVPRPGLLERQIRVVAPSSARI